MWARQVIEDRLQKARDNLDVLDKNLKRFSGRTASESPNSAVAKRRVGTLSSAGTSVKSRLHGGLQPTQKSSETERPQLEDTKDEYASEEDGETNGTAPSVKSNVMLASKPALGLAASKSVPEISMKETTQRGKRFFGILNQHLNSFKEKENEKKPKLDKRAEIEKKVERAEKMEKAEAAVERREMFRERILREEEIAQLNAKMERAQLLEDWESAMQKTKGNIMTNSRPPIFYRPTAFNRKLTEMQKRTERYIDGLIWEREEEMKQELHILPGDDLKLNGSAKEAAAASRGASTAEGSSDSKKESKVSSTGKVKSNSDLSEKNTPASPHVSSEATQVYPKSESEPGSKGPLSNDIGNKEPEKSLAEELGAPGEDIENLLVEPASSDVQKKDVAATPVIASAVVTQAESNISVKKAEEDEKSNETMSPSKKQRNYRQRSKSQSADKSKKKREDSSSNKNEISKQESKSELKKESTKKELKTSAEKRKSEKKSPDKHSRSDRKKRSDTPEKKKRKSDSSKDIKEKDKESSQRVRSPEKKKPVRSKKDEAPKKENIAVKKPKRPVSSSSSGSSSREDKTRKRVSPPPKKKEPSLPLKDAKLDVKKKDKVETKTYDLTFGSELKKVKQLVKDSTKSEPNILMPPKPKESAAETIIGSQKTEAKEPEQKSMAPQASILPEVKVPDPDEAAKIVPTHSPLKSTNMFKSINPSLLPVDHENLTFKITSAFQDAPIPPILAPPPKDPPPPRNSSAAQSEKPTASLITKTTEGNLKPATADFYPVSTEMAKAVTTESNVMSNVQPVPPKVAPPNSADQDITVISATSAKPAPPAKKRRSPSSSSSSSESDESSPERRDRKSRRSPTRRRKRAEGHKKRGSRSRRRRKASSPRRKSTSRHRRRRPSRDRRRRRRSPAGDRRRRKAASSSSSGSSSSGSESSSGSG
ncbi:muscle M-line assembly protein unc-89-like [Symsagittifera roscoffensis]|uniref:muscle M-line assembly protein unc-89-like n=1 Tax=Symsagittifera roscoffensis TaxID=84072 RepID=UPI00307C66EF